MASRTSAQSLTDLALREIIDEQDDPAPDLTDCPAELYICVAHQTAFPARVCVLLTGAGVACF